MRHFLKLSSVQLWLFSLFLAELLNKPHLEILEKCAYSEHLLLTTTPSLFGTSVGLDLLAARQEEYYTSSYSLFWFWDTLDYLMAVEQLNM